MFIKLYFYSTVLRVVAWIMKTVGDLKSFVDHFKNDINECNELQAPMIRKGLVFYIHTNIASQRLENTRSIIASIREHSAGSSVTTTPDALRWAIRHIIDIILICGSVSEKMSLRYMGSFPRKGT